MSERSSFLDSLPDSFRLLSELAPAAAPPDFAPESDDDGHTLWAALVHLQQGGHRTSLARELGRNRRLWRAGHPGSSVLWTLLGVFTDETDARQFAADLATPPPFVPQCPTWDDLNEDNGKIWVVVVKRGHAPRVCLLDEHLRENFSAWCSSRKGEDGVWSLLALFPDRTEAGHFLTALGRLRP
jgi:hypothetical protein